MWVVRLVVTGGNMRFTPYFIKVFECCFPIFGFWEMHKVTREKAQLNVFMVIYFLKFFLEGWVQAGGFVVGSAICVTSDKKRIFNWIVFLQLKNSWNKINKVSMFFMELIRIFY